MTEAVVTNKPYQHKTYEDGIRDGEMRMMKEMLTDHKGRLDNHSQRLRILERIVWATGGVIFIIQFGPAIAKYLQIASGG